MAPAFAAFAASPTLAVTGNGFLGATCRGSRARMPQAIGHAAPRRCRVSQAKPVTVMSATSPDAEPEESQLWKAYVAISVVFTNLFPVWTVGAAGLGLVNPSAFTWLSTPYFTAALAILMLSMGITLTIDDFKRVLKNFGSVGIGFAACYTIMPLLCLGLSRAFSFSPELTAGTILVGAVNGGQASNLCAYIANGDVALSVMMTTATTIGAIVMTPLICQVLIGAVVPVNAIGIAQSTIQVILAPIALGMLLNKFAPKVVAKVTPFSPVLGVASTCLLVGSSVAQCAEPIMAAGVTLQLAMCALHLTGGLAGYFAPKLAGYGETTCRTTAIETAMKSSAFGFLLASLHFGSFAVRVPAAVSVVWMSLVGSLMAVVWRYMPVDSE